jgi:hypothetical protein
MSVAYYIVLDREAGFDPFTNGKSLAKETRRLNKVARMLNLRPIDDYVTYDEADVDLDGSAANDEWFSVDEGISWAAALLVKLRSDPALVKDPSSIVADLEECIAVLEKARAAGARWRFALDF